jgi:hypothetical protein
MSIYDWTAAIKLTFDKPIANTPNLTGWTVEIYTPNWSPDGTLTWVTCTKKRIYKSVDRMSVTLLLTLPGRMKYPFTSCRVTFTGTLIGDDVGFVAPFVATFDPINIVPVFNPNNREYVSASTMISVHTHEISFLSARSTHEYISASAYDINITVTNVGGIPL